MMKCEIVRYTGETTSEWTNNCRYVKRISKNYRVLIRNDLNKWVVVWDHSLTVNQLRKYFEVEQTFYLNNYECSYSLDLNMAKEIIANQKGANGRNNGME